MTPTTVTGRLLAAFLRGLLPETRQFDQQIADIEEQAREPYRAVADAGRAFVTGTYHDGRPYKGGDLTNAVQAWEEKG